MQGRAFLHSAFLPPRVGTRKPEGPLAADVPRAKEALTDAKDTVRYVRRAKLRKGVQKNDAPGEIWRMLLCKRRQEYKKATIEKKDTDTMN